MKSSYCSVWVPSIPWIHVEVRLNMKLSVFSQIWRLEVYPSHIFMTMNQKLVMHQSFILKEFLKMEQTCLLR